ncbi:hypothetical protein DFP72DRAFT_1064536 [Ephemerocybe angulata]|uniref:DUF7918 domain-containing protein n=1 Tax=Ephemerocybe angulata TaxID=980116 RepID=A0A8H6I5K9_9AGAR|nr:hypothetical protein DFP72DRAFT_1064536 [Tulosesus angulatus]
MPASSQRFDAWIEIEGRRLEEYNVEASDDGSRVVCWTPCEAGKEFRIGVTIPTEQVQETNHSIYALLDGKAVSLRGGIVARDPFAALPRNKSFFGHYVKNRTAVQAFQFGNLELTDDELYLGVTTKRFGEITVVVASVQDFTLAAGPWTSTMFPEDYRVHERTKKGLTHCVRLGDEEPVGGPAPRLWNMIRPKVACTFVFKYRHIDVLIADGIAARQDKKESVSATTLATPRVSTSSGTGGDGLGKSSGKRKADEVEVGDGETIEGEIASLEAKLAALKERRALKLVKRESDNTLFAEGSVKGKGIAYDPVSLEAGMHQVVCTARLSAALLRTARLYTARLRTAPSVPAAQGYAHPLTCLPYTASPISAILDGPSAHQAHQAHNATQNNGKG